MEKFVEKFNVFDIFTMLLPGIIISCLFSISLSFKYYDTWKNYGNEKYVLFFIFSYVLGVIFQEIGTILDKKYIWKYLYGGEPRYIFLSEDYYENIFGTELAYKNALDTENYLKKYINSEIYENASEKEKNALIFEYCLNICEMKGITYKADKMFVISEMSRSIFWGCISTIILNMYLIFVCSYCATFLYYEIPLLVISAIIFFYRKKRYEQYRIRILIRMFLIYVQQQTSEKAKSVE